MYVMVEEAKKIWMDGKLIDWADANVHVLTHTLHYGLGTFEGIRCYKGPEGSAIFRLKEHVKRLFESCHITQLKVPFSHEEIENAIIDVVRVNQLDECYIRPICFIGYANMGLYGKNNPVQVAIAAWRWGTYLGQDGIKNGIRVQTSSFTRHHVNNCMSRAKVTGYYVLSQLAKSEAVDNGFDEALLLDTEGYVAEGPGENIFMIKDGELKTTPLTSILNGITRNTIIKLAIDKGIPIREEKFTRDELYIADEAFFTGTAAEITPIRELDRRMIGEGKPGPITKDLQKGYFSAVTGKDKKYSSWLTFI